MSACIRCNYPFLSNYVHCPKCGAVQNKRSSLFTSNTHKPPVAPVKPVAINSAAPVRPAVITSPAIMSSVIGSLFSCDGRKSRTQYWTFNIVNIILSLLCLKLHVALFLLYALIAIYPSIAMMIKRAHDIDKSGSFIWLCLIPIVGLIPSLMLLFQKGTTGNNQYGEVRVIFNLHGSVSSAAPSHASIRATPNWQTSSSQQQSTSSSQQKATSLHSRDIDKLFDEDH